MAQAMIDYQREVEEQKAIQQMEMKEKTDMKKFLNSFSMLESQPDPDFFQDDNDDKKKKRKHKNIAGPRLRQEIF